jgi:hypothetical protein
MREFLFFFLKEQEGQGEPADDLLKNTKVQVTSNQDKPG